jgi:energy-coupling factor transport system permease protein
MTYRRRATPLHAARAAAGAAYCSALALIALLTQHPLVLAAVLVAVLLAARAAGVGADLARAARIGLLLACTVAAINPLVDHNGLTVVARLGNLPPFGQLDVTLEALVYGAILGARILLIMLCFALYSAAVDPDELLRALRRVSFRSALTATLATRMLPVLSRDGRRLAEAQRCRLGDKPSRIAIVRAVTAGALDRAIDVAATLELRGYALARAPARMRRPWSRHDIAFAVAAGALTALAIGSATGLARFDPYPRLSLALGPAQFALAGAILACSLLPFADRRGIAR